MVIFLILLLPVAFVVLGVLGWVFKGIGFGMGFLWEGVKSVVRCVSGVFCVIILILFLIFGLAAII